VKASKLLTPEDLEKAGELLGFDMASIRYVQYEHEKNGKEVVRFILPMPEIKLFGIPVIFANVESVTCEVKK
jgi:hypothetical protein